MFLVYSFWLVKELRNKGREKRKGPQREGGRCTRLPVCLLYKRNNLICSIDIFLAIMHGDILQDALLWGCDQIHALGYDQNSVVLLQKEESS